MLTPFRSRRLAALTLAAVLLLQVPGAAEVPDDPTVRIQEYTDRALDFAAEGSHSYTVKRGARPISDLDLATTAADPDLEELVGRNMLKGRLYRAEIGALALPTGLLLAVDNFFGHRPARTRLANLELPPSSFAPFAADDWRSFALSASGALLALYGAWQLGELIGEAVGAYRLRYLSQSEAQEAVVAYNKRLALELGLKLADVATVTVAASPSPTPPPVPEGFPAGTEGTGAWAVRRAAEAVGRALGPGWKPFLAYTKDLRSFESGVVELGAWHVLLAATDSAAVRDLDVTVPRFGGGPTWRNAGDEWTQYRGGTDLVGRTTVDSPRALELLGPEYVERQVGWLQPGSTVVLYPFYFRLKDPVWLVHLADARFAPFVGVNARSGLVVGLERYRL